METNNPFDDIIPPEFLRYQELNPWQRFTGHLKTVHIHRKNVRYGCFRLGLYRQGLLHDLSKYSPAEFFRSVRFYDGHRSPNAIDRRLNGCSRSWLHHKGRNRHHFEYWIDFMGPPVNGIMACKMPMRYLAEMVCDRRAACIAYHGKDFHPGDAWHYYARTKDFIVIHPDTKAVLEKALLLLRDERDDAMFSFLRKCLHVTKGLDYTAETFGIQKNND